MKNEAAKAILNDYIQPFRLFQSLCLRLNIFSVWWNSDSKLQGPFSTFSGMKTCIPGLEEQFALEIGVI
jgi:hypothetical protein